jgi:hypothetical protein
LAALKARKVLSGLEKKGFVQAEGDHTFLIFYVNGKKTSIPIGNILKIRISDIFNEMEL